MIYTAVEMREYAQAAIDQKDAAQIRSDALEEAALLAVQWGNARVDDGGGNALRNYAEAIRDLKSQPAQSAIDAAVLAEREACALTCEARFGRGEPGIDTSDMDQEAAECAADIRARSTAQSADKEGGEE